MLRTQLIVKKTIISTFNDPLPEDAAHRFRTLIHESITKTKEDGLPREIRAFIGPVQGGKHSSMPRRGSTATTALGLEVTPLMGIIDLALRTLNHASVTKVSFETEAGSHKLFVVDTTGKRFRISVEEEPDTGPFD